MDSVAEAYIVSSLTRNRKNLQTQCPSRNRFVNPCSKATHLQQNKVDREAYIPYSFQELKIQTLLVQTAHPSGHLGCHKLSSPRMETQLICSTSQDRNTALPLQGLFGLMIENHAEPRPELACFLASHTGAHYLTIGKWWLLRPKAMQCNFVNSYFDLGELWNIFLKCHSKKKGSCVLLPEKGRDFVFCPFLDMNHLNHCITPLLFFF